MNGKTHAQFAIGFGYLVAIILDKYFYIGLNFYLLALMMPLLSQKGAKFPDYDQNWQSISERTTVSWIVNKLIMITGGHHRSRHTHSWDVCLVSLAVLWFGTETLYSNGIFTDLDRGVAFILLLGFYSGWISHLLSDMFNGVGVYISAFTKKQIAFVPRQLFGIKFNTGGAWERFFYKMCVFINHIMEFIVVLYPIFKNGVPELITNLLV